MRLFEELKRRNVFRVGAFPDSELPQATRAF